YHPSPVGSNPAAAGRVFSYGGHHIIRQPFFHRIIYKLIPRKQTDSAAEGPKPDVSLPVEKSSLNNIIGQAFVDRIIGKRIAREKAGSLLGPQPESPRPRNRN